jgi:hypothetical protein
MTRPRLQLSTLVLLTILAGGYIGAQFWTWKSYDKIVQGFPFIFRKVRTPAYLGGDWFYVEALAKNCIIGVAALVIVGFCWQRYCVKWIARRKE